MNPHDAKFLLRARRPDGRDAADPMFAEALSEAQRDPALKSWLEREQRFDATITSKLGEVAPPAGLREAILAGARASEPRIAWWRRPVWLAVAATVAVLFTLTARFLPEGAEPGAGSLARAAMQDLAGAHDSHDGNPAGLASVQRQLAQASLPLQRNVSLDLDELKRKRCRSFQLGGREVFEICFERDGTWYHLYAMRGGRASVGEWRELEGRDGERLVVAAWRDASNSYALVTSAGREALRRLL